MGTWRSDDEALIDEAREAARRNNTTLNEQFHLWLEQYARQRRVEQFNELLDSLQDLSSGGRKFTRDEMNERR